MVLGAPHNSASTLCGEAWGSYKYWVSPYFMQWLVASKGTSFDKLSAELKLLYNCSIHAILILMCVN